MEGAAVEEGRMLPFYLSVSDRVVKAGWIGKVGGE